MVSPPGMFLNVRIGFPQQPDKSEFVRMSAAQYLPPGGRGTAKRWMRNGDTFPFAMQSIQTVQPFPMYLFNEMHTDSEHIAVPHPPQCAHWGTFPPGEGIVCPRQTPIYRAVEEKTICTTMLFPVWLPLSPCNGADGMAEDT